MAGKGEYEAMNKFLEAFNKQEKTYEAIGREIGLSSTAIWRILNSRVGTRYKVAVAIGKQIGMAAADIKIAWVELMNDKMKQEIDLYEMATEKPAINHRKWKNRNPLSGK
jgi:hypothetical protein